MWLIVALILCSLIYWFIMRSFTYWTKKGVKQGKPKFLLGDFWRPVFRLQSFYGLIDTLYKQSEKDRYYGIYQFLLPVLLVRDPELIKQVTVKDFDHFVDHLSFIPEEGDPLWSKNLFALTGKKWRDMRSTLSPAFTSSKMKYMFGLIAKNGEQFVDYLLEQKEDRIELDLKDALTRFATDVIANTAFGVECDSLRERDNEFYLMGKDATDLGSLWKNIKIMAYVTMPRIFKNFDIALFSKEVRLFFTSIIKSNIRSREDKGIVRSDMIQLLLEARKHETEGKTHLSDEDIAAQAMVFFFAGFDSISTTMQFMAYELAVNEDIQTRLIEEIDSVVTCKSTPTYEAVLGMKYLDMVVNETLRKWPNNTTTNRVCTKPYTIEPETAGENPVQLDVGNVLLIPFYSIQRDPKYFPNPERFDPERFNEENKDAVTPYTFLTFGSGPRNCIGSRFALLEIKILFFHILRHFQIIPIQKTKIPVELCIKQPTLSIKNGLWLGFKKRVK